MCSRFEHYSAMEFMYYQNGLWMLLTAKISAIDSREHIFYQGKTLRTVLTFYLTADSGAGEILWQNWSYCYHLPCCSWLITYVSTMSIHSTVLWKWSWECIKNRQECWNGGIVDWRVFVLVFIIHHVVSTV